MIVFGNGARTERTAAKLDAIRALLADAPATGLRQHEALVAALIEAGELAQGLADADFAACGLDRRTPAAEAAMVLAVALARRTLASWRSGYAEAGDGAEVEGALDALAGLPLPEAVEVRQPEGFAHYALYPEAYLLAAAALPADRPAVVVGLRSIGTTLAALVAAALPRAAAPPATVRPVGPPFRRALRLGQDLSAALTLPPDAIAAAVDEGPGLSGSSLAAAAAAFEARGARLDRVHLLPGHGNEPGPEADEGVRRVWAAAPRIVRSFEEVALGADERGLVAWASDLVGPPVAPLVDVANGLWRARRGLREAAWPPAHPWAERRKYLMETADGTFLLRFAGLDRTGRDKAPRAAALAEAGFVPAFAGMRHGFVVERWRADAALPSFSGPDRPALLARVAAYLGFRARAFPAEPGRGAASEALLAMASANAAEALGPAAAAPLDRWRPALDRLSRRARPIAVDGRTQAWEWLAVPEGLLKADALDHASGHDLVGAQDVAWDVAGAAVELSLSDGERSALLAGVEREAGRWVDAELTAFLLPCYLAFQLGSWTLALGAAGDGAEAGRLRATVARYRDGLAAALGRGPAVHRIWGEGVDGAK